MFTVFIDFALHWGGYRLVAGVHGPRKQLVYSNSAINHRDLFSLLRRFPVHCNWSVSSAIVMGPHKGDGERR